MKSSPGPLAASHADLDDPARCNACHMNSTPALSATKCLACHVPVRTEIIDGTGYHASPNLKNVPCERCHREHRGKGYNLLRAMGSRCDFDQLVDKGDRLVQGGTHAAALETYEAALACRRDDAVIRKAFMAACVARKPAQARALYPRLEAGSQAPLAQICLRNGIDPR